MTISLGDISVRYVNLLLYSVELLGVSTGTVRDQFQLTDRLLTEGDARISIPRFMRLGFECIQLSGRADLGLLVGAQAQPSLMGLAGLTAACAPNLHQALADIAEFEILSSKNVRGHSRFYRENSYGIAEFYSVSPYNAYNYFIVDMALSVQWHLARRLTGAPVMPVRIDIEFESPSYAASYDALFHCPVRFNQPRNALVYPERSLQQPLIQSNQVAYHECRAQCTRLLDHLRREQTFLDQVAEAISPLLNTPELTLAEVAARMEMPVWTLQRKLKQHGTTFKALLDNTRKELALIYIRDRRYSQGEIAYLLGFVYPNAFQRAFKRWTGEPPGEFRRRSDSEPS